MQCTALSGSLGAASALRLQRSLSSSPLANSAVTVRQTPLKTRLQVRATVGTETKPAQGRHARREQNVDGEFYVDRTCIDCDTCRWMTPTVFSRKDGQSAVHHQPDTQEERLSALQALLACPTASIRTVNPPKDIIKAQKSFPLIVDSNIPGIYHCGYHSEKSFAAASYFITRTGGNILVDSPRYTEKLAQRLAELGGVRYMFLTHKDDVADHKKWQARFNCERILHKDEVMFDTKDVEVKLEGTGPWTFLGSDIDLIFTPGHTEAHVALLLKDRLALFSGDHLGAKNGQIKVDRVHNWYKVSLQIDSIEALLDHDFLWLLPGHGRRYKFQSLEEKNKILREVVSRERAL